MKRAIATLLTICILITCFNLAVFANDSNDESNQGTTPPTEPWSYSHAKKQETPTRTTTSPSASDTVIVTVEATDKATGEKVPVEGATVCLYVGAERRDTSEKTAADGTTTISLAGLSYTERSNATISAYKAVSSGKAIDGTARDDLFKHFGDGKDYTRYTMELHSETIDENGNWLGAPLPLSYESNKVDIVFAIDATGSMGDEINNVRNNIAAFSDSLLNRGLDARCCIIDYRDITEGERTVKHTINGSHWLREMAPITDILSNIKVEGGGDGPETAIDALGMIASPETMQWRSDAYKFAFVLTDADYKVDNNYGYTSLADVSSALKEMDIAVSVITDSSYKSDYTTLFETTNGIYANIYGDFNSEMLNPC